MNLYQTGIHILRTYGSQEMNKWYLSLCDDEKRQFFIELSDAMQPAIDSVKNLVGKINSVSFIFRQAGQKISESFAILDPVAYERLKKKERAFQRYTRRYERIKQEKK